MGLAETFTDAAARRLEQNLSRIGKCMAQLDEESVWGRGSENENAIGNLMLHLAGNVRQWILSGVGGQPDTRKRDEEFAARQGWTKEKLLERLGVAVTEAAGVIRSLSEKQLLEVRTIQNYEAVTVMEAVFHVAEHFSHHTGQIIFATKMVTHSDMGFYRHLNKPAHGEKTP